MNTKLKELFDRYPSLADCESDIVKTQELMLETYRKGGKILVCGNGGSCADAHHIVGELMKGFLLKRPMTAEQKMKFKNTLGNDATLFTEKLQRGIPAIALDGGNAIGTAFNNDVDADLVYAQLLFGYGTPNDLLIGITTSGNSGNVVNAAKAAKALGIPCVGLTGARESALSCLADATIRVPETETFKVQELHLPVYHYLCAIVEETLFADGEV